MALKGKEKEQKQYTKYVGLFNANVIAVNPTKDELSKLLNFTIEKEPEYTGSNTENGAKKVTISFWLREAKEQVAGAEPQIGNLFNVRFNLEDTVVVSKTNKKQWINNIGSTSYAEDKSQCPPFFTENNRTVREAKKGEELLYKFLRSWLSNLNYDDESTELHLDWKKLISGKVTELREAIDNFATQTVCAMATVRTGDDGKEYQAVYSYEFLPGYALDCFTGKAKKQYKSVDKFIAKVTDAEYGCKDFYKLQPLSEYNPTENVIGSSNSPIVTKTSIDVAPVQTLETVNDELPF